jgi:hypothetical protein
MSARPRRPRSRSTQTVFSDIRHIEGFTCTPDDPCVGTDSFRRALELSISNQVRSTTLGTPTVAGTTVRVTMLATSPGRNAVGVDRTLSEVTADVVDGKIVSFRSDPDVDDPQTLWWLDHRPSVRPELA